MMVKNQPVLEILLFNDMLILEMRGKSILEITQKFPKRKIVPLP